MNGLKRIFFKFWFTLFGWKVIGEKPNLKQYVIAVAPHTSNWDFLIGLASKHIIELHAHFLGKQSLFDIPIFGWFLRAIGGHPVDRTKKANIVDQVVEIFKKEEEFVIAVAPEGTRSYNPNWRTGFYHIALKANVPIVLVGFCFKRKLVEFKTPYYPTGNFDSDFSYMKDYFIQFTGKNPELGVK